MIGAGSTVGAHVVFHALTVLGDGCLVQDGAVLGKQPALARTSSLRSSEPLAPLVLGRQVTVGAGAVLFAGASVGDEVIVGDQAYIRERATIGASSVVGRGTGVDPEVTIGDRVRIQSQVYVTAGTIVEDDAFIGPGVMTTNDDAIGRPAPGEALRGPRIERGARVGGSVTLTPGVVIGAEAFVGAGSVVTKDVPARMRAYGVPARVVGEVADEDLLGA